MTTKNEALKEMTAMFTAFNFSGSVADREAKMDAYWRVLSELTAGEIVAVCRAAARGDTGGVKFMPTAAELYQAVRPKGDEKPSPDWRPHQDRLETKDGTLFITEGGRTWVYTPAERIALGYSSPRLTQAQAKTEEIADGRIRGMIADAAKDRRA